MSRFLSVVITFLGGLYFFLEFVLPEEISTFGQSFKFGKYYQEVSLGVGLVGGMAIGLGVINILLVHGQTFFRWKKGALSSFSLLFFFILTSYFQVKTWIHNEERSISWMAFDAVISFVKKIETDVGDENESKLKNNLRLLISDDKFLPLYVDRESLKSVILPYLNSDLKEEDIKKLKLDLSRFKSNEIRQSDKIIKESFDSKADSLIFNGLFSPLGMSMFSLLAFYISYAAYRTFRVQSKEALVMMLAAFLIILGQIPQGVNYISSDLPELRFWLLKYLSTPAFRAITFSSAIAGLGLAVRMWFSMEKNPF